MIAHEAILTPDAEKARLKEQRIAQWLSAWGIPRDAQAEQIISDLNGVWKERGVRLDHDLKAGYFLKVPEGWEPSKQVREEFREFKARFRTYYPRIRPHLTAWHLVLRIRDEAHFGMVRKTCCLFAGSQLVKHSEVR